VFHRKGKAEAVYRRYAITSAADLSKGVAKLAVLHGAAQGSPSVMPITKGGHNRSGNCDRNIAQRVV
jgi:hypothetical protein